MYEEKKLEFFFGTLTSLDGELATLSHARKLWYWDGAGAVEGLAVDGVSKPENCKFTVWVDELAITGVCQTIPTTEKSNKSIEKVPEWKV